MLLFGEKRLDRHGGILKLCFVPAQILLRANELLHRLKVFGAGVDGEIGAQPVVFEIEHGE